MKKDYFMELGSIDKQHRTVHHMVQPSVSLSSFIPIFSTFRMFESIEAIRGRLIGPKPWDRINIESWNQMEQPVTAPRLVGLSNCFTIRKKAYNNIYFVDLMSYMLVYIVLIDYNDFYNSYGNNHDIYVNSKL